MMRTIRFGRSLVLLLVAVPLAAQAARPGARAPDVRQRIVQILMNQARNTLALTDDQAPKLQRTVGDWAQRQLGLEQEEHLLRQTLEAQMRPGIAASTDSLPKLVYGISSNRVRQAQSLDDEIHQLGTFLTPVQLAQFQLIQERLLKNIRDLPKGRALPPD